MKRKDIELPHELGERVHLMWFCPLIAYFCYLALSCIRPWSPKGTDLRIIRFLLYQGATAFGVLSILGFVWAVATPRWLERFIQLASREARLYISIGAYFCAATFIYVLFLNH